MISIIVPVFSNRETLVELDTRLKTALAASGTPFEIVFVDDHSPDECWAVIQGLAAADRDRVRGLRLSKNVGQHMAALIGLAEARGATCVVLDADLQDPPEAIPSLVAPELQRYGAVFAGRRGRYDAPMRLVTARIYHGLLSLISGVPQDAGMFFALDHAVVQHLLELRVRTVSLVAMIGLSGTLVTSVPVPRSARRTGRSGYSAARRVWMGIRMVRCVIEWWAAGVRRPIGAEIERLRVECSNTHSGQAG